MKKTTERVRGLNRSLSQMSSFFDIIERFLMVLLLGVSGVVGANADNFNAQDEFIIIHEYSLAEPYYEWEFLIFDNRGTDDCSGPTTISINVGGTYVPVLTFTSQTTGATIKNTQYGICEYVRRYKKNDALHVAVCRFHPSMMLGSGDGSLMSTGLELKLESTWWIDCNPNDATNYTYVKTHNFSAAANALTLSTPALTFKRVSRDQATATGSSLPTQAAVTNLAGTSFTNYYLFTADKTAQNTGFWHKNELNTAGISSGSINTTFDYSATGNADETKDYVVYYHRAADRDVTISGLTITQYYDGQLQSANLYGFCYAKNFKVSADKWNLSTTLKWEIGKNSTNTKTEGNFLIFRKKTGTSTYTKLATLSNTATSYNDTGLESGASYDYYVQFMPSDYTNRNISSPTLGSKLVSSVTSVKLDNTFSFAPFQAVSSEKGSNGCIIVSWKPEKTDNTCKLERYSSKDDAWTTLLNNTTETSYTDDAVGTDDTYKYKISTVCWGKTFSSEIGPITFSVASRVEGISASRGTYANLVKINWQAKQLGNTETRYVISRKSLNDDNAQYLDIYECMGTSASYFYEDVSAQPGQYYFYRVSSFIKNAVGNWVANSQLETDGFSTARGIVNGRVSYGSGTAVEGVEVRVEKIQDEESQGEQYYSLYNNSTEPAMSWTPSDAAREYLQGKPFSIQMWVNPQSGMDETYDNCLIAIDKHFSLGFRAIDDSNFYYFFLRTPNGPNSYQQYSVGGSAYRMLIDEWNHISLTFDGVDQYRLYIINSEGETETQVNGNTPCEPIGWTDDVDRTLKFGGGNNKYFNGYIDEIRLWTKELTLSDIRKNYSRILTGSEAGLYGYWPLDEGVSKLPYAYDYSKTSGLANGNHANIQKGTADAYVPSKDQLALYGITDEQGNYTIRGIPFSGDGTTYKFVPTMGVHEFNPQYITRFVSNSSLTHNGVDFTDISSFGVSGVVYYEQTTIPVEGAQIYVDGVIASRDGKAIQTDADGNFTVDVSIGKHYITIKKDGHTFVNNGRWPADPDDVLTTETIEKEISGLTFYDNTLVTVAGRVAGGDIEYAKPLGLKQGKANIGQAQITLSLSGGRDCLLNAKRVTQGLSYEYVLNDAERTFTSPTSNVRSEAKVENSGANAGKTIVITTDSSNGEFAVLLPPVRYKVESVNIPAQTDIQFSNLPDIDASNAQATKTDSVFVNETNEYDKFVYNASAKIEYKVTSTIDVSENEDGSFGELEHIYTDINGNQEFVTLRSNENGTPTYTFGSPVYYQAKTYTYRLHAFERYVNLDTKGSPMYDLVPLKGAEVKIQNQYAIEAYVRQDGSIVSVEDNTFELDENGEGVYIFKAGLPNIQAPYTRGISIMYDNGGTPVLWDKSNTFRAVVLGILPTGNNFVTKGPDHVAMILRDPPGSLSNTTYTAGTTKTESKALTISAGEEVEFNLTTKFGVKLATWAGVGFGTINEAENTFEFDSGISESYSYEEGNTVTTTVTCTEDVSTSDGFDFVGAMGDVFIGASTNITLGTSNDVTILKENGEYVLGVKENMVASQEYDTKFYYTANNVQNILIPNLIAARNNLIQKVDDVATVERPASGDVLYVSDVDPESEQFGTANDDECWGSEAVKWSKAEADKLKQNGRWDGPSYSIILPYNYDETFVDQVEWYNSSVELWEKQLYNNEMAKVTAIKNRSKYLLKNISFDSGASVTSTMETTTSEEFTRSDGFDINVSFGEGWDAEVMGNGLEFKLEEKVTSGGTWVTTNTVDSTKVVSYTLAEDGDDDYLTVDVYEAPDGFGPIFRTRGGATCAPYEDEVVTEYYEPGYVISAKTLQIEKPELEILDQVVTGVPTGKKAVFRVALRNNSETGEDCYFGLWVNSDSNPNGAIVELDGKNVTDGITLLIPAGEPVIKTMTLQQSNVDILDYEDITLSLYSVSQPDDTGVYPGIYSDAKVSVYFQPSCSDIAISSNTNVINTETVAPLQITISNYDYSMNSLKGVLVQYRGLNDTDFNTLQEYTKDQERLAADLNLKPLPALVGDTKLIYSVDLREGNFLDQTYVFRAITVCDLGGFEVNSESNEIAVVRDMSRPQLIATPTPSSGVLNAGDDITITFNEDIRSALLTEVGNFKVVGVMNESKVAHDVALSLSGSEPVKTESTINLADRSFSTSMWVYYTADGRLLQHGTADNNFCIAVENGKLAVTVGNSKAVSTASLPANQWLYLNVNYDATGETPYVNAGYAFDATSVELIKEAEVSAYNGNGPLALGGEGLVGRVQELTLWNNVRYLSEALEDMYLTKNQYTNGLIGYWKFNEGYGTLAEDCSRNRSFTVAEQSSWWTSGNNYAACLNGTSVLKAPISEINTINSESYLLEGWFRADQSQNTVTTLMGVDNQTLDLSLNAAGQLVLNAKGSAITVTKNSLRDDSWHHIALNVLKSTSGSAVVYVDGVATKQLSASNLPTFQGASLIIGGHRVEGDAEKYDQLLKGYVDEVRFWRGHFTADVIKANIHRRVADDAEGLAAYYPMELTALDTYNQPVTNGSAIDHVDNNKALTGATAIGANVTLNFTDAIAPALTPAPQLENIAFSFVASERQIKINLEEDPYKLEGCTVFLTVRNIRDEHNNTCQPINWSVYVKQNNLAWSDNDLVVEAANGEDMVFEVTLDNQSSTSQTFAVSGLPSWLTLNRESGSIPALGRITLRFTVPAGVAVGSYDATVYATGSQNIPTPLNISLVVNGDVPQWSVAMGENTMSIIGQLVTDGVYSADSRDLIGAFRGNTCVGLASPKYYPRFDAYYFLMNVYGDAADDETPLTYKVYDASQDKLFPSVSVSEEGAKTFVANALFGDFSNPVIFNTENKIEQTLALANEGWKWFSLYINPTVNTISDLFKDVDQKVNLVTSRTKSALKVAGSWTGTLNSFNNEEMYKVNANASFVQTMIGSPVSPANVPITLKNGWNWIGYPAVASNSTNTALADIEAEVGDVIKSQSCFSIYTGEEWYGTLNAMIPGEGYYYKSNAAANKTFHYATPAANGRSNVRAEDTQYILPYKSNMTFIAQVVEGSEVLEDAQIAVFAGSELRGLSTDALADGLHFLTVGGELEGEVLNFVVTIDDNEYMISNYIAFSENEMLGTLDAPFAIHIDGPTRVGDLNNVIAIERIDFIDNAGRVLATEHSPASLRAARLAHANIPGVYIVKITYADGSTSVQKLRF